LFHAKVIRPLTNSKTETELFTLVTEQLILRAPFYNQAQLTVKGEDFNLHNLIHTILNFKS
jgi:hypothetical protein